MMTSEEDEQDVYVGQLQEVFESCDSSGKGLLNKTELVTLCSKLQLDDQTDVLVDQLLGGYPNARVGFDDFKEGFVSVLSEAVGGIESSDDDDEDDLDDDDDLDGASARTPPKYTKSGRSYGRRSAPTTDTEGGATDFTTDLSDTDISYTSSKPTSRHASASQSKMSSIEYEESIESGEDDEDHDEPIKHQDIIIPNGKLNNAKTKTEKEENPETFEAEGQMNQSISEMENALDPVSEEQHLKEIWTELGVGKDGSLKLNELATVCGHIGMDEMNAEELQQLFEKLDVDNDGKVSFQEFLQGLFQHGGPNTPSLTPRPLSTPRQKLRMSTVLMNMEDGAQTPSILFSTGVRMFTSLDVDSSGYAKPEAIIDLWENLGVHQGADILEYLQFDLNTKLNITDLSYALEQELRTVEDDNATYQAAIASYQHELKHNRTTMDQAVAEKDKLKTDLNEANNRITLLIKEGDERQAALERTKEKELGELEKRYQDQLKLLQTDVDKEREILMHQTSKQRQRLENGMEKLKDEETRLREKLNRTQKELEKLEQEILEMAEKYSNLEVVNIRQQKDLDSVGDLERRLEDMESSRDSILDEHQKFSEQKLLQLELANKELKDKNDEMTMEVEDLRQEASTQRRHKRPARAKGSESPKRSGSLLSDYTKPVVKRESESDDDDNDDSSLSSTPSRPRRRLPQRPSDVAEIENLKKEVTDLKLELVSEQEGHDREMKEVQRGHERETRDIEHGYHMEISALEDREREQLERLREQFEKEKKALEVEFSKKMESALIANEAAMRREFEREKKDLLIKNETEKNYLTQNFGEEKVKLMTKLKEEFHRDMGKELQTQKNDFTRQLEETVSRDRSDYDKGRKAELELRLRKLREELTEQFDKERMELVEKYEKEKGYLEEKHRLDINNYENIFTQGTSALRGRLKKDFYSLLDAHKDDMSKANKIYLEKALEKEKEKLDKYLKREKKLLEESNAKLKEELESRHRSRIENLEKTLEWERDKAQIERTHLQSKLGRDKEGWERERDLLKIDLQEELSQEIQDKLEEEFVEQLDEIKVAFDDEKRQFECRIKLLQDEIDDLNNIRNQEEQFQNKLGNKNRELENKYRMEVAELNRANANLTKEKMKYQQMYEEICNTQKDLESQLAILRAVPARPKVEVITTEAITPVMAPVPVHTAVHTERLDNADRDKAILEAIESQKHLLENRTRELKQQILGLDKGSPHSIPLQLAHDKLVAEKEALEETLQTMEERMKGLLDQSLAAEQYKAQLDNWEAEKEALQQQLDTTADRLAETSTSMSISNSEHVRQVQKLREKSSGMVDMDKYNGLNSKIIEMEKHVRNVELAQEQRAAETSKLLANSQDCHARSMKTLTEDKDQCSRRLKQTQELLTTQVQKFKEHLEKGTKRDYLIKDLYVENAHLIKCLELTEKREKDAERKVYNVADKNRALQLLLRKLCPAALA